MRSIVVIAHNLRSTHNVGALLRTADGLGIRKVYLTGYTPYPSAANDTRLPHLKNKIDKQISKTALGAEKSVAWEYQEAIFALVEQLRTDGYTIAGLEQTKNSIALPNFQPPDKLALLLGNEIDGLSSELIAQCSSLIEIPMAGQKESFNVVIAAAIALYHCQFMVE